MRTTTAFFFALTVSLGAGSASGGPKARGGGAASAAASDAHSAKSVEVAQKVYLQGAVHYKAGRLLEALAAFRASYDMVASPNSHIMIARTLRDRGDIAQAYAEYDRVVSEADEAIKRDAKYQPTADAARVERDKLRAQLTMVIVRVTNPPEDLRVVVGEKPIDRADWGKPVPVPAGALVAMGVAPGRPDQRQELSGPPGEELVVSFDYSTAPPPAPAPAAPSPPAKPADDDPKPARVAPSDLPDIPRQPPRTPPAPVDRTWTYVAYGAGGAGLVTFITFGALNHSVYKDLTDACPNMHCPPEQQDQIDKGRRYQALANVGLGVALIGAGVGTYLLLSSESAAASPVDEARRRPGHFAVTDVAVGPGSFQVRGAF
jgi:hypothetical protein